MYMSCSGARCVGPMNPLFSFWLMTTLQKMNSMVVPMVIARTVM